MVVLRFHSVSRVKEAGRCMHAGLCYSEHMEDSLPQYISSELVSSHTLGMLNCTYL